MTVGTAIGAARRIETIAPTFSCECDISGHVPIRTTCLGLVRAATISQETSQSFASDHCSFG